MATIDSSPISNQMSRRAVLLGGAVLGAVGAAGLVTSGQPAAAQALIPQGVPKARVGATFDLFPFKKGTTWNQAVDEWNARTGTQMRCWKVYYQDSKFPTSIPAGSQLRTIINRRIQALVCFRPAIVKPGNKAHVNADFTHMEAALKLFLRSGLDAEICLYQEVGPRDMTAAQYHATVRHYGPMIRNYYPLTWNAPGYLHPDVWTTYDPGQDQLDGYALDLYGGEFTNKGYNLEPLIKLAGDKPVGVWEIGNTDSNTFFPSKPQLDAYMDYLRKTLAKREAQKLPVGSVAWYMGPADAKQHGQNEIVGTHPNPLVGEDVKKYRELYDAVNQVTS
jgi:hypothetical protein